KKILKCVKAESLKNFQLHCLSGGEIQRVLLAKALLKKPDVLVLDEPTQGIDFKSQIFLYELIDQVRHEFKCSILIVSHDLNLVMAKTNNVLCLNNHICCFGTPENIINNNEFISLFGENNIQNLAVYHHAHDHSHNF
ncbi:ATP-binding cassette domain-containing protein, partial [Buchnera aphidicola]|nr:ATP-binding cassette domain-containing protein [Buchnera aphidicola]